MNKQELITKMSEKADMTKVEATKALNAFIESVEEALEEGDKVTLVGFGTFEVRERAAREGRNPKNPDQKISIPARKAPVFKSGKGLKDLLNK